MNKEIKELLFLSIEIISVLNELSKIENGEDADYSDVDTDLKWSLNTLKNRLFDLKRRNDKNLH